MLILTLSLSCKTTKERTRNINRPEEVGPALRGDPRCAVQPFGVQMVWRSTNNTEQTPSPVGKTVVLSRCEWDCAWAGGPEGKELTGPGRKFRKRLICRQLGIQETKRVREVWEVSSRGGSLLGVKLMAPGQLPDVLPANVRFCEWALTQVPRVWARLSA